MVEEEKLIASQTIAAPTRGVVWTTANLIESAPMYERTFRAASVVLVASLAAACQKPQAPQLVPREVVMTELGPTGASFRIKLAATNPNSFALSANSFRAHLVFDGGKIDVGTVNVTTPFALPASTTTELDVPVTLSWQGVTALATLAAQKPVIPYVIDGTVNVGGERLNVDLPYSVAGSVTQAQIMQATMKGLSNVPGLQGLGGLLPQPLPKPQ